MIHLRSTQRHKAVGEAMQALGLIKIIHYPTRDQQGRLSLIEQGVAIFIKRSFKFIPTEFLSVLFKLSVRTALEYCVPAWSPHLLMDIDLMEEVQC